MSNQLLLKSSILKSTLRTDLPEFFVGSIVAVHYKYRDGEKTRVQVFKGLVTKIHRAKSTISPKNTDASFTVIKNSINNIKIERTFPFNSPFIEKIDVLTKQRSIRSNLNNLTQDRKDYAKTGRFKTNHTSPKKVNVSKTKPTKTKKPVVKTVEAETVKSDN